ncbi:MAG: carbohydrate kinase family protein [Bacteroidetes bacterium]|nr:carbohydrate kinase family protein [Bacteroidota bacterium]
MNKPFNVIVVGEINVDLIFNEVESFPEVGKEKLAEKMTLTLGSSAAIFACNLSALGMSVSFIGKIGNDIFGHFCKEQLEQKGVDTSMLIMSNELKTGATAVLNFDEDRANVTYQGAMKNLCIDDITKEMLKKADHLHFSSYFLQPGFKNDAGKLFKMANECGLSTSFDMQWDPTEKWDLDYKAVLPFVDIFLPNETELLKLTGKLSIEAAIEHIKDIAKSIIVKLGNKGSLSYCNGKTILKPAFLNNKVVDAIGAGDSFNAGFIYKFLKEAPVEACQTFGNLMGAVSTTAAGGTSAFTDLKTTLKIAKEKFDYEG